MKSEIRKIIYAYFIYAAFISFIFLTAIGAFTAMSKTKYISTGERSPVIEFTTDAQQNGTHYTINTY